MSKIRAFMKEKPAIFWGAIAAAVIGVVILIVAGDSSVITAAAE